MKHPRILCLAAHPDDVEHYMGGALLLMRDKAAPARVVILTDGERGTLQPEQGTRRDEARAALDYLGMDGRFLGLPDGLLAASRDLESRLAREIDAYSPELIFAPHAGDSHPDHAAMGRSMDSLCAAGLRGCWRYLDLWSSVEPSHVLCLGEDYREKEALILFHGSQIPGPEAGREHLPGGMDVLARAMERDRRCGGRAGYGEPYVAPRPRPGRGGGPAIIRDLAGFSSVDGTV
ncbi:MAG: PIG-L deacetylase family protein [Planctomycetota bacterium]